MADRSKRVRNVRPDALDFRDLPFRPNVAVAPQPRLFPSARLPVKDQGGTNACTGFALARVVEHLLRRARRPAAAVSPYMLYSMARRYDEFPGLEGRRLQPARRTEGLVQARCLCRRDVAHRRRDATGSGRPEEGLVAGGGQPAARCVLPHRHPLDRRHPLRAERGRRGVRQRGLPCRLGRGHRPAAAEGSAAFVPQPGVGDPAAEVPAGRQRARLRSGRLRRAAASCCRTPGARAGARAATRSSPTTTGCKTPWTAGWRSSAW